MPTSILLVGEQSIFRTGLHALIDAESDLCVIGEAGSYHAVTQIARACPDLVVLDVDLSDGQAGAAVQAVNSTCGKARILALSSSGEPSLIEEVLREGATGLLLKDSTPDELLNGIRSVAVGEIVLSAPVQDTVLVEYRRLLASGAAEKNQPHPSAAPSRQVLGTKLHRPRIFPHAVPRERLFEQIDHWLKRPLTLVSAPAGYGKSTLISQYLATRNCTAAWISLDERDNDLRTFLTYWVEAIRQAVPRALAESASLLAATRLPPPRVLTATLVNEMAQIDGRLVVVLDDYHQINTPEIHALLRDILRHPPRSLHVILSTRSDPPLDLLQMRTRRQIGELRAQSLGFVVDETTAFLDKTLGEPTTDAVAMALTERTEGWITGIHLIALAARNVTDLNQISPVLPGEHQTLGYLVSEVLAHQTQELQHCLLKTSILNRFNAALCEALCLPDMDAGSLPLDEDDLPRWLVRHNLFVISLDHQGHWYRYHHLFQDLLQSRLEETLTAENIAELHMRASNWFAGQGLINDALKHALAAHNFIAAAELVEKHSHAELKADGWHVVEQWLSMFPAEVKQERPGLLLAQVWVEHAHFRLDRIPPIIEQVTTVMELETADPLFQAEVSFFRGFLLYWSGEAKGSVPYLEEALAQASGRSSFVETNIEIVLSLAYCMAGRKNEAIRDILRRIETVDGSQDDFLTYRLGALAFIHTLTGELAEARVAGKRLQVAASRAGIANSEAWGLYSQGCSYLNACEFEQAIVYFTSAVQHRYVLDSNALLDSFAGLALAEQLRLREEAADKALAQLSDYAREVDDPYCLAIARSCEARLALLRGDKSAAAARALSTEEIVAPWSLFLWVEVPAITQARLLLENGSTENLRRASELLAEIRRQSEACHFTNQLIEVTVLQALAARKFGDEEQAMATLREALTLAAPGGWLRPFVEAGQPINDLGLRLDRQDLAADQLSCLDRILAAFPGVALPGTPSPLREPLTEREEQILRLLATELSAKEIAAYLVVSVTTVRAHTRNVYNKLDVHSRFEAVQRARELGIV
jgi:LuxR family maltose regulon positive regulatory protein